MHFTSLPWYSLILQLLVFCYTTCWKRLIIDVGGRLISFKACLAMGALVYIKVHFKMAERGEKKICPVKGTMKGDLWGQHFSKYFVLILCICPIIWDILNWFLWADGFTSRGVEGIWVQPWAFVTYRRWGGGARASQQWQGLSVLEVQVHCREENGKFDSTCFPK